MRKFFVIVAFALMAGLSVGDATAQVRFTLARVQQVQQRRVPPILSPLVIPPSAAVTAAIRANPGAKPLGINTRGNVYIIKLKQGNTIRQVRVNGITGAVGP